MSSLIFLPTRGTVTLNGLTINGCADLIQENDSSPEIKLSGDAACELHRRAAVAAGTCPTPGDQKSLCLAVASLAGKFNEVIVKARTKKRKDGSEHGPDMHDKTRKLKINNARTQLTYKVIKNSSGSEKLKLTIKASVS